MSDISPPSGKRSVRLVGGFSVASAAGIVVGFIGYVVYAVLFRSAAFPDSPGAHVDYVVPGMLEFVTACWWASVFAFVSRKALTLTTRSLSAAFIAGIGCSTVGWVTLGHAGHVYDAFRVSAASGAAGLLSAVLLGTLTHLGTKLCSVFFASSPPRVESLRFSVSSLAVFLLALAILLAFLGARREYHAAAWQAILDEGRVSESANTARPKSESPLLFRYPE